MRYSFSFISRFQHCPMQWYYRYRLKPEIPEDMRPNNPLYLGILFEELISQPYDKAVDNYYFKYPIIQNEHIHEVMKAEHFASQVRDYLPKGGKFEFKLDIEGFIGYIDYVVQLEDGTYAIYDFKYSNYGNDYKKSLQLHLYKYFYEVQTGNKVSKLAYIVAPKPFIKKEFEKDEKTFRKDLTNEIKRYKIELIEVEFDDSKVDSFLNTIYELESGNAVIKRNMGDHCSYCDYAKLCYRTKYKEEKEGNI